MDFDDSSGNRHWDGASDWVAGLVVIGALLAVPVIVALGMAIALVTSSSEPSNAYGQCALAEQTEQSLLRRAVFDVLPSQSTRDLVIATEFDMDCEFGATTATARWDRVTADVMVEHLEDRGFRRADQSDIAAAIRLSTTIEGREVQVELDQLGLSVHLDRRTAFDPGS